MAGDPVVSHEGVGVRVFGHPEVCPIPGLEVFRFRVLVVGPVETASGQTYDVGPAISLWVWLRGVVPEGLRPWVDGPSSRAGGGVRSGDVG